VEVENTSELLGFISNVLILLLSSDDTSTLWFTHDGWEFDAWGLFSGETGFDHS